MCEALSPGAVADLIVGLGGDHQAIALEGGRVLGARPADPPVAEGAGEGGGVAEGAVPASALAGEPGVQGVVEVVRPAGVEPPLVEDLPLVEVGLGDEEGGARPLAQLREDGARGGVLDGVDRVEAEAVEAVLAQPGEGVVDHQIAHLGHGEVDAIAPGAAPLGGEVGREFGQVVPLRAEVVVDDVEHHRETETVGAIHERAQVVGRAVGGVRGERLHPVVPPVPGAGERRHRHELDPGDAQVAEDGQGLGGAGEGARTCEGADVQLVEHPVGQAAPGRLVSPGVGGRIDDLGGAVDAFRLPSGARVGAGARAIDHIEVANARGGRREGDREDVTGPARHRHIPCAANEA